MPEHIRSLSYFMFLHLYHNAHASVSATAAMLSHCLYLLLVVGDNAADKVGVGVPERGHEVTQLLLVQLAHGAEHALTGFGRTVHGV